MDKNDVEFDNLEAAENNSPLSWLTPLLIVGLLIILGYSFCSKSETDAPHARLTNSVSNISFVKFVEPLINNSFRLDSRINPM